MVVPLTKDSQSRPSVHTEVGIARSLRKPIIPVIEVSAALIGGLSALHQRPGMTSMP